MTDKKVGNKLHKARKDLNLTQIKLAEKVGISSNYYSMIERGIVGNPGTKIMTKIAKILKLKPSDVFPY